MDDVACMQAEVSLEPKQNRWAAGVVIFRRYYLSKRPAPPAKTKDKVLSPPHRAHRVQCGLLCGPLSGRCGAQRGAAGRDGVGDEELGHRETGRIVKRVEPGR